MLKRLINSLPQSHRAVRAALALALVGTLCLLGTPWLTIVSADTAYFNLAAGNLQQDWTNTALITTNDDWSGVPSITGYQGNAGAQPDNRDPQTVTDVIASGSQLDVAANVTTSPNIFNAGGVIEFAPEAVGGNPTVALNGSGTADFPNLVLYLNTTGRTSVTLSYNIRDLDASADDNVKQVATQFRVRDSGNPQAPSPDDPDSDPTQYTNIPAGFTADATDPNLATRVTAVSVQLPAEALNQPRVEVRIITSNNTSTDEVIGIDDILVSSTPSGGESQVVYAVTSANNLVRFNTNAPSTITTIGTISGFVDPASETIIGIDFRPSGAASTRRLLYAVTNANGTGRVYIISLSTGAASLISTLSPDPDDNSPASPNNNAPYSGLSGTNFGVDFNPVPDRLRVVSDSGQNLRINVDNGLTITDGTLNPGTPAVVATAYTNPDVDPNTSTMLYDIDAGADTLVLQNPPNDGTVTTVGALGVDASGVGGFDIARDTGTAFAVLTVGGASNLYSVSLTNGAATLVGVVAAAGTPQITGISIADLSPTAADGTISGRVMDSKGQGIPLVTVSLLNLNTRATQSVVTKQDGNHVFTQLETEDVYTISVRRAGYVFEPRSHNVIFNAGEQLGVNYVGRLARKSRRFRGVRGR